MLSAENSQGTVPWCIVYMYHHWERQRGKLGDLTRIRVEWKVSSFLTQSRDRLVTSPSAALFPFDYTHATFCCDIFSSTSVLFNPIVNCLLYIVSVVNEWTSVEDWWGDTERGKSYSSANLSITNPTWLASAVRSSQVTASATTYRSTFLETKLKKQHSEIYGLKILCLCLKWRIGRESRGLGSKFKLILVLCSTGVSLILTSGLSLCRRSNF